MQTRHSLALVLLLILAAGACQQAPSLADRWTPLELGEHFEATCVAGIHAGGMGRFAEPELDPAADEPDASRRQILIRSWLLRLDPVSAAHLLPGLGRQGVEGAQLISVDSIETLLEELTEGGGADLLTAPSVLCLNGQIATVAQLNQLAFFESFQVNRNAQGAIVDPKVGILEDGMQLRFRPRQTGADTVELEFDIEMRELLRPLEQVEVTPFPGTQPLTLQVPVYHLQEFETQARLQNGQVIVFGPLSAPFSEDLVYAFVSTQVL